MTTENPTMFVDKFYQMDPAFEDLLPDGTFLKDGMVVLIEDSLSRVEMDRAINDDRGYDMSRARENNRWCTVSHVQFRSHPQIDYESGRSIGLNHLVSFVATYGDGTKTKRTYNVSYSWIVKKDSIPQTDTTEE